MDAKQLLQALHQLNKNHNCQFHIGVYASDTIPTKYKRPAAIIANTDEQHKPGTHWICFYIPKSGNIEYFDSYGFPPLVNGYINFLKRQNFKYNKKGLQSLTSNVCGHYCLCFLGSRMNNNSMNDFLKLFSKHSKRNDQLVRAYVNKIFKKYKTSRNISVQNCCAKNKI